uniref:Endoplasmic reticulum-Golgi intermediate compartment protein 3 n=1 Tax=Angiostrongylus cantonensis TaxID=6313 RepID=A0A0K0DQI8_ANGCA
MYPFYYKFVYDFTRQYKYCLGDGRHYGILFSILCRQTVKSKVIQSKCVNITAVMLSYLQNSGLEVSVVGNERPITLSKVNKKLTLCRYCYHGPTTSIQGNGIPGFVVQYEFSPLVVRYEERRQHLITFLVSLCAIIGGVFTVAQLIDSIIYHSSRAIERKLSTNKLG